MTSDPAPTQSLSLTINTMRKFDALNLILLNIKSKMLTFAHRRRYDKIIMFSRDGQLREQLISYLAKSLQLSLYFKMRCSFERSINTDADSW